MYIYNIGTHNNTANSDHEHNDNVTTNVKARATNIISNTYSHNNTT